MVKIAHLSDIHFGSPFDCNTWRDVVDAIVDSDPDLIIVSGDLCHQPSPAHLLAAKRALDDLSQRAGERSRAKGGKQAAELVVIPGNHDVFDWGVSANAPRINWYERIFNGADTAEAQRKLAERIGCELGFNETCRDQPAALTGRVRWPWERFRDWWYERTDFVKCLGQPVPQQQVRTPSGAPVLLALFDSNPDGGNLDIATGVVNNSQLSGLRAALNRVDRPYLARIAVVHHHVLPIAFAPNPQAMTGEPMMVLRNAGAILSVLADYRFDLVLHGHWHKAQFARFELGTDSGDNYPISVAAAGSAAWRTQDPRGNCFNLITIFDNGRIEVKHVFYGGAQAPDPNGTAGQHPSIHQEPMMAVKRRAHARALERHFIECESREQSYEITETGDLLVASGAKGLRLRGNNAPAAYPRRPLSATIPSHSRFITDAALFDDALPFSGTLGPAPDFPRKVNGATNFWIVLPGGGLVSGGEPVDYRIGYACSNNMTMSQWEATEKVKQLNLAERPNGWDNEFVGIRITYPMRRLRLSVKFPESLMGCQVKVRCLRHSKYPNYTIDGFGDAVLSRRPDAELERLRDDDPEKFKMVEDDQLQREEQQRLQYRASQRTWLLDVDRPMVGCTYELRWKLPDHNSNPQIEGTTKQSRIKLLRLRKRVHDPRTGLGANDQAAMKQFDLLRETLEQELRDRDEPHERRTTALFVYDSDTLSLCPVLMHCSLTAKLVKSDFVIPLGNGIAGAAFLQRRIIPWGENWVRGSLIQPVSPPPTDPATDAQNRMVNIIAIPVYHHAFQDEQRPPPWAAVGVVCMSSSSYGSRIAKLGEVTLEADSKMRRLRVAAQTQLEFILKALANGAEAGVDPLENQTEKA